MRTSISHRFRRGAAYALLAAKRVALVGAWVSCQAVGAPAASPGWKPVAVPGVIQFEGVGWLRAWVKVPDSYFATHERNLFEESVGLYIEAFDGAHEAWVNGVRIGAGGAFPPAYRSGG